MKALILRTGSGTIPAGNWTASNCISNSSRVSLSLAIQESGGCSSSGISLHVDAIRRGIRRAFSEPDIVRSGSEGLKPWKKLGSRSFPSRGREEEDDGASARSLTFAENPQDWPQCATPVEELGFSGGGIGRNWNSGGGRGDESSAGGFHDREGIGAYYRKMLKTNPNNPLLLRNYGKYLHEVEGDMVGAEEYYGRAILASPGDGEVLSLYGNLIWEKERDERRAKSYFDQAVEASPEDCMVLGSYAHFMWEAGVEDEEVDADEHRVALSSAAMVEAC